MKRTATIALFLLLSVATFAQRQKVTVSKDGAMMINGEVVAYIEREGCKLLSPTCQFFITDENDNMLITITQQGFTDKSQTSREFPNGTPVAYLVFSFKGFDRVGEIDSPFTMKEETIGRLIAQWHLIKGHKLDPEAVEQFITANGCKFSEKERLQNQPPAIQIINQQ